MSRQTSPEGAVFRVSVIGSQDNRVHNEGTLEATPTSLIYTDDQGSKFNWPLVALQKYGSNGERLFTVETNSQCPTGAGVYIFSTPHAPYLENIVARHLSKLIKDGRMASPDPDVFLSLPRNGLRPQTTPPNGGMLRSTSLWSVPSNQFHVKNITDNPHVTQEGVLEITNQDIIYTDGKTGRPFQWPIMYLRRYGYDGNVFSFDASRRCPGGGGVFAFVSHKAAEIQSVVRSHSKSYFGSQASLFSPTSPPVESPKKSVVKIPVSSQADDSPVFHRSSSFLRRARSAMDLNRNLFEVVNISDDRKEVGKGTLEVTSSDLLYIDRVTDEKWRWPLKYLRRYGCDGNVFSFEAGRRCPGGEGLYAFSCSQASEIHEAIVLSINTPKKSNERELMCASNLSLADPSLGGRRGSDQTYRRGLTNGIHLTPPPALRKQIPLPKLPTEKAAPIVATPPRSPSVQSDRSITPRGSVSSPSFDENDSSSVSSGVLTPPLSGMSTPPPKPPRSERRRKKKSNKAAKVTDQSEAVTNGHRPIHTYEDPILAHNEYLDSLSHSGSKSEPPQVPDKPHPQVPGKPHPQVPDRPHQPEVADKKKTKKVKPSPPKKTASLMKLLGKRRSIDTEAKTAESAKLEEPEQQNKSVSEKRKAFSPERSSLYANLPSTDSHRPDSMYANVPSQMTTDVLSTSPSSCVVPMPHRGNTPPLAHIIESPSTYRNVEVRPEPRSSCTYANIELKQSNEQHTPTKYAEVEIIDGPMPGSHDQDTSSLDFKRRSRDRSPDTPSPINSLRSNSIVSCSDDGVQYQALNFTAMKAVENLHQQRGKNEQFAEILDRHTLKQNEVLEKNKTGRRRRT